MYSLFDFCLCISYLGSLFVLCVQIDTTKIYIWLWSLSFSFLLLQPDLEWNLVVKFLLQALQLWAFCEAIPEHGNGNSYGEGIDHDKIQTS